MGTRTIAQLCGLYLQNEGTYRQSEKKLVKQQYLPHMFSQYIGLLAAEVC